MTHSPTYGVLSLVLRVMACFSLSLSGCGRVPPSAPENRLSAAPEPRLATACTSAWPRIPVANLVGGTVGVEGEGLPAPWTISLRSTINDGFALLFVKAGYEEAVLVSKMDRGANRVIGAASAGTPCATLSLIHHCRVADEPDPWVFAELAASSVCVDPGTPVVRAWRADRDGRVTRIPESTVTCGSSHCM